MRTHVASPKPSASRFGSSRTFPARYGVRPMDMYMLGAQPIEASWDFAITPELFPSCD
jgi:hypothetical protein